MARKKRVILTEKMFNQGKQLFDLGLNNKQVMAILKVSEPTVCRLKQANNWIHYKEQRLAEYARQAEAKNKVEAVPMVKEKPVAQPTSFNSDEVIKDLFTIVQDQSEIIKRMDQSLTWLAEHAVIQSVNTKRRFF